MNTWRTADPEKVIEVLNTLTAATWPQTEPETNQLLSQFEWNPDPNSTTLTSNLGITPGVVYVIALRSGEVTNVSFDVCDTFPDDDAEAKADFIQDLFAAYAARFRQEWGKPAKNTTKPRPEIWWKVGDGCAIKLKRTKWSPDIEFTTPKGVSLDRVPEDRL